MKTLAIVDDNRSIHYIIESIFADFRVVGASDGRELSILLEHELPDIILLDVMMPGEDGFSIASRLAGALVSTGLVPAAPEPPLPEPPLPKAAPMSAPLPC